MKKQLLVGMMIMTSAISFNTFAAGLNGAKAPKEMVMDYMKQVEEYKNSVKTGKVKASSLETAEALKQQDKTMDDLGLTRAEKASIKTFISSGKGQKIDVVSTLNVLLAAKNGTFNKTDAESASIRNSVDASVKLMANADLIGERKSSSFLAEADFKDTTAALKKLSSIAEKPLSYEMTERDSYTAAINKATELSGKTETFEEAFVKGIMETAKDTNGKTGVSKEKAMEIVRKLLKCV